MQSGAAFPRRVRLTARGEFSSVFAEPIKSGDRYFTVLARWNGRDLPRLGLTIAKKVAKHAVVRNRIKRIIRESFRHHQALLRGWDVVVMGRIGFAEQDNAVLFSALQRHWRRIAARCAPFSSD